MIKPLHIHLIAGFLGSGKTTAIVNACKFLVEQGKRIGVVTNDQGKYLVDTSFFRLQDFPTVEVGGGCFCCHYVDLERQLTTLIDTVQPDVIFAESVGSCADLVATVVKPMLQLQNTSLKPTSYSTFVDVRLLRMRLNHVSLPFSDGVVYIFDKQIEETRLLVVNKVDLVPENQRLGVLEQIQEVYPDKVILPQTSLDVDGIKGWVGLIETESVQLPNASLQIDYDRYGDGEHKLAWLDEEIEFYTRGRRLQEVAVRVVKAIMRDLRLREVSIGHVKFIVRGSEGGMAKISFPTLSDQSWESEIPMLSGSCLHVLINARAECPSDELEGLIQNSISDSAKLMDVSWSIVNFQTFHPSYLKPTYRLG
jgi:G3E family GTPase